MNWTLCSKNDDRTSGTYVLRGGHDISDETAGRAIRAAHTAADAAFPPSCVLPDTHIEVGFSAEGYLITLHVEEREILPEFIPVEF